MPWWIWVAIGLSLIGAELFVAPTGLYLLFIGIGALTAGLVALAWLADDLAVQLVVFSGASAAGLLLFRRAWTRSTGAAPPTAELVGESAIALEPVASNAVGAAELRGTVWRVRNIGKFDVGKGQHCRVERVDGLELWVRGV